MKALKKTCAETWSATRNGLISKGTKNSAREVEFSKAENAMFKDEYYKPSKGCCAYSDKLKLASTVLMLRWRDKAEKSVIETDYRENLKSNFEWLQKNHYIILFEAKCLFQLKCAFVYFLKVAFKGLVAATSFAIWGVFRFLQETLKLLVKLVMHCFGCARAREVA